MRSEVLVFIAQLPAPDVDTRMDCDVQLYVSYDICLTNYVGARRLFFAEKRPVVDVVWVVFLWQMSQDVCKGLQAKFHSFALPHWSHFFSHRKMVIFAQKTII